MLVKEEKKPMKLRIRMVTLGIMSLTVACLIVSIGVSNMAFGHCDTMKGPIIPEAKAALEKGDVTPILKWVKKEHEREIRTAFADAVIVRGKGSEAKQLADKYFLETLIRLHRAGEGAPYTGIKNEPVEPIIAMAEKALVDGSANEMIKKINGHMAQAVREKLQKIMEARVNKDISVRAGREYVEAYVIYMHYVEGIHAAIMSAGSHQHEAEADGGAQHKEHEEREN